MKKKTITMLCLGITMASVQAFANSTWVCSENAKTFTVESPDQNCPMTIQGNPVDSCYDYSDPTDGKSPCLHKVTTIIQYTLAKQTTEQITANGVATVTQGCTYFSRYYVHGLGGPSSRQVIDISCGLKQ